MPSRPNTEFLNVDLDLESRTSLTPLVEALGEKVVVLHSRKARGTHFVTLELGGRLSLASSKPNAEKCILAFSKLIELLPSAARRAWNESSLRRFDVGVQAGATGSSLSQHLRAPTVRRVAKLNAEIGFTIYPADRAE